MRPDDPGIHNQSIKKSMVDDSTVLSYQLTDAVYQSMDNLAIMGPLFHPLTESHVQASMEVEEKVSPTASLQIE